MDEQIVPPILLTSPSAAASAHWIADRAPYYPARSTASRSVRTLGRSASIAPGEAKAAPLLQRYFWSGRGQVLSKFAI